MRPNMRPIPRARARASTPDVSVFIFLWPLVCSPVYRYPPICFLLILGQPEKGKEDFRHYMHNTYASGKRKSGIATNLGWKTGREGT